jgi:hypothetical protein
MVLVAHGGRSVRLLGGVRRAGMGVIGMRMRMN